uniref:Uncharacterized protein n=1 Tax=Anguilla anguilla TaxID=7936 RepID=A0A0E9SFP7_ANGAN
MMSKSVRSRSIPYLSLQ